MTNTMLRRTILPLIFLFCSLPLAFADAKPSLEDKLIASTLRTMAKAYVATANMDKLKENNAAKINRMSEERFDRRYAEAYPALKSLPSGLRARYGITDHVTRSHVVKTVMSLDKKKIYELIDALPDAVIAEQFKLYWARKGSDTPNRTMPEQIKAFWDSIVGKINRPPATAKSVR